MGVIGLQLLADSHEVMEFLGVQRTWLLEVYELCGVCVADCRRRMAGALLLLSKKKSGFAELLFNKRCVLKKNFSLNL